MIPLNIIEALHFLCATGHRLGPIPFIWNPINNTVQKTKSIWKLGFSIALGCYTFFNFCFMTIRWAQAACCINHVSYGKLFMNLFSVITHATGSAFYLTSFLYGNEVHHFIFHLVESSQHFKNILAKNHKNIYGVSMVHRVILPCYFYSFAQCFVTMTDIINPKYIYSLFNFTYTSKWKLLPFGLIEWYMSTCLATVILFYIFIYLAYVSTTISCLDSLAKHSRKENCWGNSTIPILYAQLQIVNIQFHNLMQSMVLPLITFLLLSMTSIGSYATIKFYGQVKFPGFLGFPIISITTFVIAYEVFPRSYQIMKMSNDLIHNLLNEVPRGSYEYKVLRAGKPLNVTIDGFYRIKRGTFVTYAYIIADVTVNAMLTF